MISVIIPFLNEGIETSKTVISLQQTIGCEYEIILVDDCSSDYRNGNRFVGSGAKYFRMDQRKGTPYCRDFGVSQAKYDNILMVDAHMSFEQGFDDPLIKQLILEPKTIVCSTCKSMNGGDGYSGAEILKKGIYFGRNEIFIEIGLPKKEGTYEVPCIIGAFYGFNKEWYNYIGGFQGLKYWGNIQTFVSAKSKFFGGNVKVMSDITSYHLFKKKQTYKALNNYVTYNKLFILSTLFPELSEELHRYMDKDRSYIYALAELKNNKEYIKYREEFEKKIVNKTNILA